MDPVVHFEIPADDVERAKKFYKSLFGWDINKWGDMDYQGIITTPVGENHMPKTPGAINGGMRKRMHKGEGPSFAVNVPNVDQYVEKATKMGSKVVMPKTEIGGMGYYAMISDTEGNLVGLWQDLKK